MLFRKLSGVSCRVSGRAMAAIAADGSLLKFAKPIPPSEVARAAAAGELARLKLADGTELYTPDSTGNTALIWAADEGHLDSIRWLLSHAECDINVRGYLGNTALSRAARNGNADVVRLLLASPGMSSVNELNDKKQSALHFAAFKKKQEVVAAMLEFDSVDTCVLDRKGRTPAEDTSCETIRSMILAARGKKARTA